jgi:sugar phosphate isomerase/epimerase
MQPGNSQVRVGPDLSDAQLAALLAKLKSVHMDVVSWVPGGPDGDAAWRRELGFAKQLHVKNVITTQDPSPKLDRLANEFGVNIVTFYPPHQIDTSIMLHQLNGLSRRSGVLASVAAWQRSGGDPVAMIHALGSRVIEVHFSDVDAAGHDVPLGTGVLNLPGICAELQRQNFHWQAEVEWPLTSQPPDSAKRVQRFVQSVNAFSDAITKLAGSAQRN